MRWLTEGSPAGLCQGIKGSDRVHEVFSHFPGNGFPQLHLQLIHLGVEGSGNGVSPGTVPLGVGRRKRESGMREEGRERMRQEGREGRRRRERESGMREGREGMRVEGERGGGREWRRERGDEGEGREGEKKGGEEEERRIGGEGTGEQCVG